MLTRLQLMREKLNNIEFEDFPSNIKPAVRNAILQLQQNPNIVIRQADKGSCIVIQDKSVYIWEGEQYLEDLSTYTPSQKDRTEEITHKANWAINHHHQLGTITNYHRQQILSDPKEVRTQRLYFLRKVHKHPHKLRPIVSACSGPTDKISGFLVKILTPHLEDIPSLMKNSVQVVNILESLDLSNQPEVLLVTLDVKSLYQSIPQGVGIEMILQRVSPTNPPTSRSRPFKNMLRDLMRIVLGDNHFSFNGKLYTQKKGVAIGTKCAPHLANIFLASLEKKALNTWEGTPPIKWLRFIDDILMIWGGGEEELSTFLHHLNSQMTAIQFTMEMSRYTITFLDLQIFKGSRFNNKGILDTSLHVKETNPQCFLHYSSCHPHPTFKTIMRGEIIRTLRCTSSPGDFSTNLEHLMKKFRQRGYPKWLIREPSSNIQFSMRKNLLQPKERRSLEEDVTIFTSIFNPAAPSKKIRKALEDRETPFSPMVLRPRPTTILNKLVKSKNTEELH